MSLSETNYRHYITKSLSCAVVLFAELDLLSGISFEMVGKATVRSKSKMKP